MTDREVLQALLSANWGSCEELAMPTMEAFIRGHLAGDPDVEKFYEIYCRNVPGGKWRDGEYAFVVAFQKKHGAH